MKYAYVPDRMQMLEYKQGKMGENDVKKVKLRANI